MMNENFPFTLAFAITAFCGFAGYMASLLEMSSRTSRRILKFFRAIGIAMLLTGATAATGVINHPEEAAPLNVFLFLAGIVFSSLLIIRSARLLSIKEIEEMPFSEIRERIMKAKPQIRIRVSKKAYVSDPGGIYCPGEPTNGLGEEFSVKRESLQATASKKETEPA